MSRAGPLRLIEATRLDSARVRPKMWALSLAAAATSSGSDERGDQRAHHDSFALASVALP
jgi:hypothetical protein